PELVALVKLREILLEDLVSIFTIERICPALGEIDSNSACCDFVLELRCAPAGAPVELQPIFDAIGLRRRVMRENAGMGDRVARAYEAVIGMPAPRINFLAADHRGGRGVIALGLSGDLAHMAVLAGDPFFACRAVAILIP